MNPLGVMFPMAFPGPGNSGVTLRGDAPDHYVLEHLARVRTEGFGAIELTHLADAGVRTAAARVVAGLDVTFAAQVVQLQNIEGLDPFDISDPDEGSRRRAVARLIDLLPEAEALGACRVALLSGADPVIRNDAHPDARREHVDALVRSLAELAERARDHGVTVVLVPFDRSPSPVAVPGAFKGALVGPLDDAVGVLDRLRADGVDTVRLGVDTAHLTQNGEGPDDLVRALPYLEVVHVSNCVLDADATEVASRLGDRHPAFGIEHSAVDVGLLRRYARVLRDGGYAGPVTFEVRPVGDEDPWDVLLAARAVWDSVTESALGASAPAPGYSFGFRRFLPDRVFDAVARLRRDEPALARDRLASRVRCDRRPEPLVILAADHPARMVTAVGDDPVRMGDRHEYLARLVRALTGSGAHGVMATADVLEELALVDHLVARGTGPASLSEPFLDGTVLVGSVNRGGLAGLEHELFDPVTGYGDPAAAAAAGLDGLKYLVRIPRREPHDREAQLTLALVAQAMDDARRRGLDVFLEALPVRATTDGYVVEADPAALIRAVSVASGLSSSAAGVWLKLPCIQDFGRVARATTHPILLLGGPARSDPAPVIEDLVDAAAVAPHVVGALVGRTLLYPGDDDPGAVTAALVTALATNDLAAAGRIRGERRDQAFDRWTT